MLREAYAYMSMSASIEQDNAHADAYVNQFEVKHVRCACMCTSKTRFVHTLYCTWPINAHVHLKHSNWCMQVHLKQCYAQCTCIDGPLRWAVSTEDQDTIAMHRMHSMHSMHIAQHAHCTTCTTCTGETQEKCILMLKTCHAKHTICHCISNISEFFHIL